jgi:hypothetical protein
MKLDMCKDFELRETATGWLVVTPLEYDDHDQVVVFADRMPNGLWYVHDDGEAALRLMFDSVDPDSARVQAWLEEHSSRVGWNERENQIERLDVKETDLVPAAFKVAQAAVQIQAMTAFRVTREESQFKEEVLTLLRQVADEAHVEARFDVPVDQARMLNADCLMLVTPPLAVIVASTREKLLEAELTWSYLKQQGDPTRVLAVVEDAKDVGQKEFARAQYFTDKTLPFRGFEQAFRTETKRHLLV